MRNSYRQAKMNGKIKLYKIASYLGAFSYITLGLLTIVSIINDTTVLFINLIMGGVFTVIGYYLYLKSKSIIKLLSNIEELNKGEHVIISSITRFLFFEIIFIVLGLLLGIILLSGATLRVFGENLPIFG